MSQIHSIQFICKIEERLRLITHTAMYMQAETDKLYIEEEQTSIGYKRITKKGCRAL